MKLRILLLAVLVSSASFISCEREAVMNGNVNTMPFSVTGTIRNDTTIVVPTTAKLYSVWVLPSGSPENLYVYGVGTVDPVLNTFTLTYADPPPAEALNSNELGVAYLMLVDADLAEGEITDSALEARIMRTKGFYGSVNDRAIVYVAGNPATANDNRPWVSDFNFKRGYNLGKSWYNPDTTFDGFRPDSGSIELVIEPDPTKFSFPNWY